MPKENKRNEKKRKEKKRKGHCFIPSFKMNSECILRSPIYEVKVLKTVAGVSVLLQVCGCI